MRLAIAKTREGIAQGQTPFGACIVREGKVIACGHNQVWATTDITAHGEVQTIRQACQAVGGVSLSGATIYSTTEPCPMCFSAIHWAGITRIVCGAEIADAEAAGFRELVIPNETMKREGKSPIVIERGCLREECRKLFEEWKAAGRSRSY